MKPKKRKKKPSLSLLTQRKPDGFPLISDSSDELPLPLGRTDFAHFTEPHEIFFGTKPDKSSPKNNNKKPYDPHRIFTSLQASSSHDLSDDLGLIKPAFSFPLPRANPFIADLPHKTANVDAPRNLSAPMYNARFVVLSWSPPISQYEEIETYTVFYRQENSNR